jgi:hypothetical protein
LMLKELAIFLNSKSISSVNKLETAGTIESLIFIAFLRIPSLTVGSNLGIPSPPQFFGA